MLTIKVELDDEQERKYDVWREEQNILAVEMQKRDVEDPHVFYHECWSEGYPYEGAIGGRIVYKITNTSIGIVCKAYDSITKNEIDLTDYESW